MQAGRQAPHPASFRTHGSEGFSFELRHRGRFCKGR